MITKTYNDLSKEEFYKLYFDLMNVIDKKNKLAPKQILILVEFLLLEGDKFKHARFGKLAKNKVIESLKEKYEWEISKENLVIHLLSIEKLKYIEKDIDGVKYFSKAHQAVLNKALQEESFFSIVFRVSINK